MTMRESPSGNAEPNTPRSPGGPSSPGSTAGAAQSGAAATSGNVPPNQSVKEQVGAQVGPAVDQAQEKAGQAFGQVRQQVTSQIDSQKEKAADGLTHAAEAVRKTGEQLRQQNQAGVVANYADDAAETIERLAGFLRERDIGQIMGETERFARQRPTMFLASAFTLGLVAARFLKSSSPNNGMSSGYGQAPRKLSNPSYTPAPSRPDQHLSSVRTTTPSTTGGTGTPGIGTSPTTTSPPPSTQSTPNLGSSSPPNRGN